LIQDRVAVNVEIAKIRPSSYHLRAVDEGVIDGLMMSVKLCGLLQPIMVTQRESRLEVIFGNHRLEACKRLGWQKIPALIVQTSKEQSLILQIVENIQRNVKINPVAEAQGYRLLMDGGMSTYEIAKRIGKSYQYVWSRTRLLETLHPSILEGVAKDKFKNLKTSHAEQLSMVKDPTRQLQLAKAVEDHELTLDELEKIIYKDIFTDGSQVQKKGPQLSMWRAGQTYFIEKDRVAIVSFSTLNVLVDNVGRKARAIGRRAGRLRRKSFLQTADRTVPKLEWIVRCFNEGWGWGNISIKDSRITLRNSVIHNAKFVLGYMEGLLGLKLQLIVSARSQYRFAIATENSSPHGEIDTYVTD